MYSFSCNAMKNKSIIQWQTFRSLSNEVPKMVKKKGEETLVHVKGEIVSMIYCISFNVHKYTQYGFIRNTVKFQLVPVSYFFQFFN